MAAEYFNWKDDTGAVVLRSQPATAVYRNADGGVVILQQAFGDGEEEPFVHFASDDHVRTLIKALQREIGDAP